MHGKTVENYQFNEKNSASNSSIKHYNITALTNFITWTYVTVFCDVTLTVPDKMEFNLSANLRVSLRFVKGIIYNGPYSKLSIVGWR
jgi:hypothetical protein